MVKPSHCFHEPDITLLYQVNEPDSTPHIVGSDRNHKSKICFHHSVKGLSVAIGYPLGESHFFFASKKRNFVTAVVSEVRFRLLIQVTDGATITHKSRHDNSFRFSFPWTKKSYTDNPLLVCIFLA